MMGCKETFETKSFPKLLTLDTVDSDSTGATIRCEVLNIGTSTTTSFGFLWSQEEDPTLDNSYKIVVGTVVSDSGFVGKIDQLFYKDTVYHIRAFATFGDKTVYGNAVSVKSNGCKMTWSKMLSNVTLFDEGYPFGSSNNLKGYVMFQFGVSYSYDPVLNKFSSSEKYPANVVSLERFTSVKVDDYQYLYNGASLDIYKLSDGKWSFISNVSSELKADIWSKIHHNLTDFGFSYQNNLYLLNEEYSFVYHPDMDTWEKLANYPSTILFKIVAGATLSGKAYLLNTNKDIQVYDAASNQWTKKTTYPGTVNGHVVSFSYNNKIYFGLDTSSDSNDVRIWSYDPDADIWNELESIPGKVTFSKRFYFNLNGNIYIGYGNADKYDLYKLDLSKLESKR